MYQILLLFACGIVNMSCSISTTAVSLITPAAEEEFTLNSTTKGIFNTAPFIGETTSIIQLLIIFYYRKTKN